MVISNMHTDYCTELNYGENILRIVDNHKHLGVTYGRIRMDKTYRLYSKFSFETITVSPKT